MLNFGGAIAQMKSFSSASDAAIRSARSESASAARAGELRIRSLDRQITRFGMTRDAALALRNVDTGNTQIASELTAREAQLADMHMRAASAKAAEAAAAAKLSAEHMQLAAAVRASHDAEVADALAAEKMRAATDPLYAATARLNAEIAESTRLYRAGATSETEYARQQGVLTGRLREVGTAHEATTLAAKRHGGTLTQLSFQLNDVATMAALGAPPMQIFASQAGQVFQVAQQAQGGIKGFAMQIGGLALAFSPLIAVAAVAGVAFWRFKQQTEDNAGLKKYVESLGLTHKELKKLGDVSVSTGDMLAGFGKTLQDRLGMQFSGKKLIDYLFAPDDATQIAKFVAQIYGTFVGGYKAVVEVWGMLPSALKELFVNAANGAVAAIEMIVNKSIAALNRVIGASNSLFGTKFAAIGPVDLGRITQTHAGAGRAAGVAFGKNVQAETKNAYAAMGRFAKDWASNSVAQTMKRTNEAADKLKADRTTKAPGSDAAEKLSKEQQALVAATKDYADAQVDEANKLGLTAKQLRQYADAAAIAKAPTDALKLAIRDAAAVREAGYTKLSAKDFDTNVLQPLRDELSLYGLVGPARAEAALGLEKQAFIAKNMDDGIAVATARWTEYYVVKSQLIGRDAAAESEAERIRQITDRMNEMVEVAQRAGNAMASAFGRAGSAIGDAVSILAEYQARQAQFASERTAAAGNVQKLARIDRAASQAQLETFGDMASAAKGFFKENSAGWRAVAAAEKVYRVAQLAMSLQAMVQSALETTTRVAGAAAQATAEGTAGIAAQSKLPFPFNIAAMAATGAALVAAGIAVFGGHGGASKLPSSNIGSGTVFGDSAAKSESIKNALDALKQVDTLTNQYSRQMMMSLKSIDSQIGGVTNLVLRAGNIDASAGVQTGFKSNAVRRSARGWA